MLLTVTIRNREENQFVDIQVNSETYIKDTFELLSRKGILHIRDMKAEKEVYSVRNKEFIDIKKTYEQGNIYTGDILELPTTEDEAYGS